METIIEIGGKKYRQILEEIAEEPRQEIKHITGYERVSLGGEYSCNITNDEVFVASEDSHVVDDRRYECGNYYSSREIAKNNARADALMRKLRRFSAEHEGWKMDWNDKNSKKWRIYYNYGLKEFFAEWSLIFRMPFVVYFHSREIAEAAIEEFREELDWYFNEYKWVL